MRCEYCGGPVNKENVCEVCKRKQIHDGPIPLEKPNDIPCEVRVTGIARYHKLDWKKALGFEGKRSEVLEGPSA